MQVANSQLILVSQINKKWSLISDIYVGEPRKFIVTFHYTDIEYRFPEWDIINPVMNGSITLYIYISKTTGGPFFIAHLLFFVGDLRFLTPSESSPAP